MDLGKVDLRNEAQGPWACRMGDVMAEEIPQVIPGACQEGPASKAKLSQRGDRACRRGGSLQSERLRPLRQAQVQGLWRAVRRLPIEETTLRAQPERVQFPTLWMSTTSADFHGADAFITPNFLPRNSDGHVVELPLLAQGGRDPRYRLHAGNRGSSW